MFFFCLFVLQHVVTTAHVNLVRVLIDHLLHGSKYKICNATTVEDERKRISDSLVHKFAIGTRVRVHQSERATCRL